MTGTDALTASYSAVAERYAAEIGDELATKPIDRALYAAFAELVRPVARPDRSVADVGCGPGHVTAHLAELGLPMVGIDAAPGMIEVARRRYAELPFEVGVFDKLPVADGGWAGVVAAYSLIHLDRDGRRRAFAELHRAIAAGGWLLAGFHVSDAEHSTGAVERVRSWWDIEVDLDFRFLDPVEVGVDLAAAGFTVMSRTDREPWPRVEHPSRRSYLLACRG
ncbi:MAG TPA: class I SAM-dependent methyltransferase [Micromonosporaceae bacterium]